eukprot:CAMPEP_0178536426 /NCGR_PEP_ID=MMETSP0696-20121128/36068_1 /TAXON_ID=265572 /ORGANISM="Extubocellulus spinifer, Strain CCMP396" /LENGTH=80 /DNA_ID=CAMNT_0020168623 /DNA_START=14 /DNA_END=259 /DNA_ORIENTATION=-
MLLPRLTCAASIGAKAEFGSVSDSVETAKGISSSSSSSSSSILARPAVLCCLLLVMLRSVETVLPRPAASHSSASNVFCG